MGDSPRAETPVCKVITINIGEKKEKEKKKEGGKGKGGTPADRRKMIVTTDKHYPGSLIFCQEISAVKRNFKLEVVDKCGSGVYDYAHTGEEAAVMWSRNVFHGDRQSLKSTDSSIILIVEELQRKKSDVDVSEVHTRTAMVELKCLRTGGSFLAVSWHGPHSPSGVSDEGKLKVFYGLICFLREVCEMKKLSSFIIGGDFNFDTSKIDLKDYEGVTISRYDLCDWDNQRLAKSLPNVGQTFKPYKDTFIVSVTAPSDKGLMTVDITVNEVKPYDLESESSENRLLDHVPVVGDLVCTIIKQGKQSWNRVFSVRRALSGGLSFIFKKKKTCTVFLSSYKTTSGSLGEREMLWEYERQASVSTAFSSSPKLSRVFLKLDRNTENMFSISYRKHCHDEKGNSLLTLARASSVSPSSYTNTIFNQSARVIS